MLSKYKVIKHLTVEANSIYPLESTASIEPEILKETVEKMKKNTEQPNIEVLEYKDNYYILDGIYVMLASNILNRKTIEIDVVDTSQLSYWYDAENVAETLQAVGISTLYDLEGIGGFSYAKYPESYRRE